jgi:hypothetical protein
MKNQKNKAALPLVNIGGGIRKAFTLSEGYVENPVAPDGFRCAQVKVSTDPDGVTRKAFRYTVKTQVVDSLQKKFKQLADEVHQATLAAENRRLKLVFQRRKLGFG